MNWAILAFAAGIGVLQAQPDLPDPSMLRWLAASGLGLLGLSAAGRPLRIALPLGALLLGFAWAGLRAEARLADALPEAVEGRDVAVRGVIASLPQRFENGVRFEFEVGHSALPVPDRLSLAWYGGRRKNEEGEHQVGPTVRAGERWQFTVRLKRPHGNLNPTGFDYEAWLFEQGIRATGYVRPDPGNRRLDPSAPGFGSFVERLREGVRDRFERALPDRPYAGVLVALAIGDQRAIDPGLWRVFSNTGVTHLMSISGLHVTMVASLAWLVANGLWRRSTGLPLRLPAQKAAAVAGFLAAFAYALLAGFAVPAQRTLYMLGVVALALWSGRRVSSRRVLALALLLVLLIDPWAVLSAGFWLSFGAVALLFYIGAGRLGKMRWFTEWGRAQWAVTIGMVPALLALFQQFSLLSPVANAIAIPVVSFGITPLVLAGMLPPLEFLLVPAHGLAAALMAFLEWLAGLPWAVWQQHAPPVWAWILALAGTAWLLLPRGFPARWAGVVLFVPMLSILPPRPAEGEAVVTVLDVGQGLAVHVQTASRDLVYDTGPAYSPDANSGNRIILPYLRALGVRRLDGLMITHADKDHSGGAASILETLPIGWVMSSLPPGHPMVPAASVPHRPCADGDAWTWDGVRFEVLHPPNLARPVRKSNDLSCVLKLTTPHGAFLLTSDIEAASERVLLFSRRDALASEVLLAPHHGSRTSSIPAFIEAVGASTVIFPVGYRNRFGHPRSDVVERYRETGARLLRTDRDGALTVRLGPRGIETLRTREVRRRYWHGR